MHTRIKIIRLIAASAAACALLGCASAKVTERRAHAAGDQLPRPSRIIVHNIAATPADIPPDSPLKGFYDKRATPQSAKEVDLGRKLGSWVAQELVKEILALGMPAERAGSGPPPGNNDVLIKGAFVSVDKGSRAARMLIGFGAGAAKLETYVAGYQITPQGPRLLGEGQVTAKGGKMPGMIVPVAGGAAMGTAATSAAISGGLNVVQEAGPESMTAAAKRTAKQIAKRLAEAFERYGWLSTQ